MNGLKMRVFLLCPIMFLMISCGGQEEGNVSDGTDAEALEADRSTDPDQLAGEIADNYLACMDELETLLADRPEPEALKPLLSELTERYIDIFVGIGYRVDTHDSTAVDGIGRSVMSRIYGIDIDWMGEASSYYHPLDTEVSAMIGELNIITQYAFFELLERQRPSEAERLGLVD
ncbi:MAG: hypothetical protein JXA64_00135 [Candidatus Fermentibacteraceae bacterium]|nr:hypothetical protein [Candidatus Fermentibacteraceae bacterium]MBN2607492.1 hypothetical protein [Candidatus Fermentibacteraceae bacterium]